ncbi:MAG: hypothetical protein R3296_07300 [Oleiphilaceae bacterium]|nr:hypothetical protein [Oleiphilaceae bacterium]
MAESLPTVRFLLAGLTAAFGLTGCALDEENFSQYPGFAQYLAAHPLDKAPPDARERSWLEAFRPQFYRSGGDDGPIAFYDDYVSAGRLYDGQGRLIADDVDRDLLNRHRNDPGAVLDHNGKAPRQPGTARVPARVSRDTLSLPGLEEPLEAAFLSYHLVFPHSGIATGIPAWQRALLNLVGDADNWHALDHYAAVVLVMVPAKGVSLDNAGPRDLIPLAAVMQQHNYMRSYLLVPEGQDSHPGQMALDGQGRVAVDVAQASHALFPHRPGRHRHRAVRFLRPERARYLISGEDAPFFAGHDITHGQHPVDYQLQFLQQDDAFYSFQGWLGERRRLPGRDAPPGAFYNTLPPLQPERVQLPVFFWHEEAHGYPEDLAQLDLSGWRPPGPEALAPFWQRLVKALPCRDDWALPCPEAAAREWYGTPSQDP